MLNVCNVFIFLGDFKLSLVTLDVISFVCIPYICIVILQGNDDGDDDITMMTIMLTMMTVMLTMMMTMICLHTFHLHCRTSRERNSRRCHNPYCHCYAAGKLNRGNKLFMTKV